MMKDTFALLGSIALAILCWGSYGPVLQWGGKAMGGSSLRPFICVGLAYFLIAVVVPVVLLKMFGEKGAWTTSGIIWSLIAGAAGAIGALGIILAVSKFHGNPLYVMPLVFGGAPVVNTFTTMWIARSYRQASPLFFAGLILVVAGAVTVLFARPNTHAPAKAASPDAQASAAHASASGGMMASAEQLVTVSLFTAMTALAWGVYGPTLHKGQSAMLGSRLRPFLCVGLAYFLIAVVVPTILLGVLTDPGEFTFKGSLWSLAGGAAGALGALGIIMAFNFGGKPLFVMPLVFGGAPVVNTFIALSQMQSVGPISPIFYAGLIAVIAGAVTVLLFAPKAPAHGAAHAAPAKQPVKA